jgi:predicted phage terminase large subunit-like protein
MDETQFEMDEELLRELSLLQRLEARDSMMDFVVETMPEYSVASHHRLIVDRLEAVERGDIRRLMLFMPPRHGKSELASKRFPAWFLGRNPARQIISASYNSELAGDFGRAVRNIIAEDTYQEIFPDVSLAQDSQSAARWHTNQGGSYIAAGVGSAITGRGAHLGIIDDPIKDRMEAGSELMRDRIWDWYTSVFYTRLMPGASVIIILTRWHDDDLAGRLLNDMKVGGDQWDVLSLPALAGVDDAMGRAPGDALWPAWYDHERLEQVRSVIGPRDWSSLYQQDPQAEEGSFFLRGWIQYYDKPPEGLRVYGASDYATKDGEGDYTVHGVCGIDGEDNLYILDWWRDRATSDVWVESFLDLVDEWSPQLWGEESGQIRASLDPYIQTRVRERRSYVARKPYPSVADKRNRARAIQARMASGKVFFSRRAPWTPDLISELLRFDAGTHDDQVDVMSLFGRMLDEMRSAGGLRNFAPRHVRKVSQPA